MQDHNNKKLLDRLKRIEGQVRGIHEMVDKNRYCMDILTQLSSAAAAINRVEEIILRKHMDSCVTSAIKSGSEVSKREKLDEVMDFLRKFRK